MVYCPIFELEGNRFIHYHYQYTAGDFDSAIRLGNDMALKECLFTGATWTGEVYAIQDGGNDVIVGQTKLYGYKVTVLSGPLLEEELKKRAGREN